VIDATLAEASSALSKIGSTTWVQPASFTERKSPVFDRIKFARQSINGVTSPVTFEYLPPKIS